MIARIIFTTCMLIISHHVFGQDDTELGRRKLDSGYTNIEYYKKYLVASYGMNVPGNETNINNFLHACNASIVSSQVIDSVEKLILIKLNNRDSDAYLYLQSFRNTGLFLIVGLSFPANPAEDPDEKNRQDIFREYYDKKPLNKNDK